MRVGDLIRGLARLAPCGALFGLSFSAGGQAPPEGPEELWQGKVEPILTKSCLKCHAGVRQWGGLDLRSLATTLRGGEHGPAIVPGKPEQSRLLQYVLPGAAIHMPPDPKKQLPSEAIAALQAWIARLPPAPADPKGDWVDGYVDRYERALLAAEPAPVGLSATATIDRFLESAWRRARIQPAPRTGDAAFLRRVTLDLAGRIPTRDESARFLQDTAPEKRERLVDALLASDDYARRFREVFDTVLMGRPSPENVRARADRGWNAFLEDAFKADRPWNETVRDILIARPVEGARKGASWFLAERNNRYQAMAEAVAPVAFGVKIGCAQCHNHPLAWEIEQRHYWGLVAAFNRSKNVDTQAGPGVAESAIGGFINFANLKKESQPATMVFLNGKSVAEKAPAPDEKEVDKPELYLVPPARDGQKAWAPAVPKFSRREALADAVTHDNPRLARALVNRVWGLLMGRGFVQPVDQMDSKHRPSHPALLDWLATDFEKNGYRIKPLVRAIVLTRAYQLDTKPSGKTPPRPETFARAVEKPLSAEQLVRSLQIATAPAGGYPAVDPSVERGFIAAFPDLMPDTYTPSLQQALFLSNSPLVDGLLKPTAGSATARLAALPTDAARVHTAFQLTLGRAPDATEMAQCRVLLKGSTPEAGARNLLWALLTSAEFQVNH